MKEPNDFSGFIVGFHAFLSLEESPSHRIRFCPTHPVAIREICRMWAKASIFRNKNTKP
jgi:hypothetical protein